MVCKRDLEIVVLSDLHLGTYGCQAKEILKYLKSIEPKIIILNGDIIDMWQFSKRYWPDSHMKVLRKLLKFISEGVTVYYLTGNHDELLRKFDGMEIGNFHLQNKLVLEIDGEKAWFFHGDIFDVTMQHSKWLAKLGSVGYDLLILINSCTNFFLNLIGREKMSFSKKIKAQFKNAVKFINNFENIAADLAIANDYSQVICGHIHQPEIKEIKTAHGSVLYLNSGDWVENMTALEYRDKKWTLFKYEAKDFEIDIIEYGVLNDEENLKDKLNINIILKNLQVELQNNV